MCSDTAHQHGSHLAVERTRPHLQRNTASTWYGFQAVSDLALVSSPTSPPTLLLQSPYCQINHTKSRPISKCPVLRGITQASLAGLQDSLQICLLLEVSPDSLKPGRRPHHVLPYIWLIPSREYAGLSLSALTWLSTVPLQLSQVLDAKPAPRMRLAREYIVDRLPEQRSKEQDWLGSSRTSKTAVPQPSPSLGCRWG